MSRSRKITLAMLERIERRFRRSRPGSVLILVVALLVLLALLGTAYINTAQTDRYSSAQNSFNTEIDLLVQGVENITESAVVSGLFGYSSPPTGSPPPSPIFHFPEKNVNNNAYSMTDYPYNAEYPLNPQPTPPFPNNARSAFIADRYPTLINLSAPASNSNYPIWQFISALPTITQFESPYVNNTAATPSARNYTTRIQVAPTSIAVTQSSNGEVVNFPALQYQVYNSSTNSYNLYNELAGDADGDGVADCGLFRLTVGQINGVTYYGGVRVVDDCAAINSATAWQPNPVASYPTTPVSIPGNFYPSNIDLNGLISPSDNLTALNNYRFNYALSGLSAPSPTPFDERETTPAYPPAVAPKSAQQRSDFSFGTQFEAFWMQLGRRIENPGYITASAPYQALPVSEMQTMGRDFILRSPWVSSYASSSSTLEQDLPNSVFTNAPTMPYQPTTASVLSWYTSNFDFVNQTNLPIRSMLVTQNAVSNFTYSKLYSRGNYTAGATYNFGDWVYNPTSGGASGDNRSYVCVQQTNGTATDSYPDPNNPSSAYWEREPWVTGPTKVSANTATFGQLWLGYFSAMSAPVTANPIPAAEASSSTAPTIVPTAPYGNDQPANAMFASSLRTNGAAALTAQQMILLRSALAAVNTLDLRDNDDDVTSRQIVIPSTGGAAAYNVMVYGTEKEPYITEVYASDDAPGSTAAATTTGGSSSAPGGGGGGGPTNFNYIAIELYNPYSTPISLYNWQLATISRAPGASAPGNPVSITSTTTAWASAATAPVIGPGAYLVLVNSLTPPSYITTPSGAPLAAGSPPTATAPNGGTVLVPDLGSAFNNELVILRPRNANGSFSTSTSPTNTYTESATNPIDLVPVDSYDFTGLPQSENSPKDHAWHYIRPSLTSAYKAWHFVYPGGYNTSQGQDADHPRQSGTQIIEPAASMANLSSLGVGDAAVVAPFMDYGGNASVPTTDRPLQIANQDFGGPKPTAGSPAGYPYGGFARNADLLQVTYIGAYRIEAAGSTGQILELNPVTLDSAMANDPAMDTDTNALTSEQYGRQNIGRFCPIHWGDTVAGTPPVPVNYIEINPSNIAPLFDDYGYPYVATTAQPTAPVYWPRPTAYNWTHDLFDYVTVQAPHDDYLPDTDPLKYTGAVSAGTATPVANSNYLVANAGYPVVANGAYSATSGTTPNTLSTTSTNYPPPGSTEETAPVHGRININTASWRVLAALPMFDNPPNPGAAADMAKAIVYYRDVDDGTTPGTAHPHGPFQSIEELDNVVVTSATSPTTLTPSTAMTPGASFRTTFGEYLGTGGTTPNANMTQAAGALFYVPGQHGSNIDGDLSPFNSAVPTTLGGDQVYGDFENQNLALNRISNLITTRSDSFTAYIIVQGWRNVGTTTPQLVVQRRAAFIIDRSTITPANNTEPSINNVPVN
jgi:DNA uptake protein ComE-like DNA-binding protein